MTTVRFARRGLALLLLCAATVSAQSGTRRATNLSALLAHPGFFHQRPIVIVGTVAVQDGELRVSSDNASIRLVSKGPAPDGLDEVRGEFWDIGRMQQGDPKLAGYDLKTTFKFDPETGGWPRPGQVTAIIASTVAAATPANAPSIRNVVLFPSRYAEQRITLTGQFGGRNLLGDLPDAPAQSRYDFVLRSADAAIWVTNIRPRGKDFELALDARIDTGRWLEVSGTLQQGRGLQWLDGAAGTLKLAAPPKEQPTETRIQVEPAPPPEVVFSTPIPDETDVALSTAVRIQFSRDIDGASFRNHLTVKYTAGPPDATTADPEFTTQYLPGTRVLEIRFKAPLDRFRTVTIALGDGVIGTDKQPLKPWTLSFQTGA